MSKTSSYFFACLLSFVIFSKANADLLSELSTEEKFYWSALFFMVDKEEGNYYMRDWVKSTLFGLAAEGNYDSAPKLCNTYGPIPMINFANKFNTLTNMEVPRAGRWVSLLAAEQGLEGQQLYAATRVAMLLNMLQYEQIFSKEAKDLAEAKGLDVKSRISILLGIKTRYTDYSECPYSWGRETYSDTAVNSLRKAPASLLKFFLSLTKKMAIDTQLGEEYNDFIYWLDLGDVDAAVDLQQDPLKIFREELEEEAQELGISELLEQYDAYHTTHDQQEMINLVLELQMYDSFRGVAKSWWYHEHPFSAILLPFLIR